MNKVKQSAIEAIRSAASQYAAANPTITKASSPSGSSKFYLDLGDNNAAGININDPRVLRELNLKSSKWLEMLQIAELTPMLNKESEHLSIHAKLTQDGKMYDLGFLNNIVKSIFTKDMEAETRLSIIESGDIIEKVRKLLVTAEVRESATDADVKALFA